MKLTAKDRRAIENLRNFQKKLGAIQKDKTTEKTPNHCDVTIAGEQHEGK